MNDHLARGTKVRILCRTTEDERHKQRVDGRIGEVADGPSEFDGLYLVVVDEVPRYFWRDELTPVI